MSRSDCVNLSAVRLYYYRDLPNFGDMLNPWLWDKLLPGTFSSSPEDDVVFAGIGTILNSSLPPARKTIVFSSGAGYLKPVQSKEGWTVFCVRGPLTAQMLGLSAELAVTDGAALVRRVYRPSGTKRFSMSFMPHEERLRGGPEFCRRICSLLGLHLIDPRDPVEAVIGQICDSRVLVSEAMHGAIVADALRVPWIPVRTTPGILQSKWRDWMASLGLEYCSRNIGAIYDSARTSAGYGKRFIRYCLSVPKLYMACKTAPRLSDEAMIECRTVQLEEKLEAFRRGFAAGLFA